MSELIPAVDRSSVRPYDLTWGVIDRQAGSPAPSTTKSQPRSSQTRSPLQTDEHGLEARTAVVQAEAASRRQRRRSRRRGGRLTSASSSRFSASGPARPDPLGAPLMCGFHLRAAGALSTSAPVKWSDREPARQAASAAARQERVKMKRANSISIRSTCPSCPGERYPAQAHTRSESHGWVDYAFVYGDFRRLHRMGLIHERRQMSLRRPPRLYR
jgi:hypothetical protein